MTVMKDDIASADEKEQERIICLVEQGFTPSLARSAILARSREFLPLTIWLVDNSSSMLMADGKRLLETSSQNDVRVVLCTRWEELSEAVRYHAQLSALLEAPTKFILLNKPAANTGCPQEMSIGERGSEWIPEDLETFLTCFSKVRPGGVTPLTMHLRTIYHSIQHLQSDKIVLVLATDGKPTDEFGNSYAAVDREFELTLKQIQFKAWVVVRLCTNEDSVLKYYQNLDDQLELDLEVLDDYLDEAKEVYQHNPWLTYSLCLHRCREMGMSCHSLHRWLDWLDERALTRSEIYEVLQVLGIVNSIKSPHLLVDNEEWKKFCKMVDHEQKLLMGQKNESTGTTFAAFLPWNPMLKRPTSWVNVQRLQRHWSISFDLTILIFVVIVAIILRLIIK